MIRRASGLPNAQRCPGFAALRERPGQDSGGAAADTGSAVHRIAALFHGGVEPDLVLQQALVTEAAEYIRADYEKAEAWGRAYMLDPRNSGDVVVPGTCEAEVKLELPPDEDDPTQRPIPLVGHIDQLRVGDGGVWRLWDIKTGSASGPAQVREHAWQLAAYTLAAEQTFGRPVLPGGIIRIRGYDKRGSTPGDAPVHFQAPWDRQTCERLLESFRYLIGMQRQGMVLLQPGTHCQWCPAGGPERCWDMLGE